MNFNLAIAALEAEIERREDEIVAIREVIARLKGRGVAASAPPPEQRALPAPGKKARKRRASQPVDAAPNINGQQLQLNAREAAAFSLLADGYCVSVDAMEEVFGAGQARHQGVFGLKKKLLTAGKSITWTKGDGYRLIDEVAS